MRRDQLTASQDESLDVAAAVKQLQGLKKPSENQQPESAGPNDDERAQAVVFEDGTKGWVVRNETHEERIQKMGGRYARALKLADQSDQLFDNTRIEKKHEVDPVEILREKKGDQHPDVLKIMGVKKAFAGFVPTAKGVAPAGSPEAIAYENAMRDLREGKFRLPTVDEYKLQKEELKKEKEKNMDNNRPQEPQTPVMQPPVNQQPDPIAEKRDTNSGQLSADALPPKRGEAEIAAETAHKVQPINLAKMEEKVKEQRSAEANAALEVQPPVANPAPPENVVQFEVKAGQSQSFYASLPDEEKDKVKMAKTIKINETDLKDVPTSIRTIDSISEYRKIIPRRISGEYVEVALPNSGYIATVGASGSFAMATVLPDQETGDIDYQKQYQFCFNNLVSTSIGTLSYADFVNQTSPNDLNALIGAIYRASCPPKQKITLTCGNPKCGKDYEITFNTNDLIDVDALDNETKIQINNVIAARDVEGKAKEVHNESPVMLTKTFQLSDDVYVTCKSTDGQMFIERTPLLETINERYGSYPALMILFIKEMRRKITPPGFDKPDWFTITDPIVIAEELYYMTDELLETLRKGIETLHVYSEYVYSFKGPFTCPHCGRIEQKVDCPILQLVFRKVSKVVNNE